MTRTDNNSLGQYLSLYDEHLAAIEEHSPALLNERRREARCLLDGQRLPDRHTEGYERTSINEMLAPDFGVNINRVDSAPAIQKSFRCSVPTVSTLSAVVANDIYHPSRTLATQLPEGVFVGSMTQACREIPQVMERYYGALVPATDTPAQLNTLLAQDGVVVYLHRGIRLERPLQLINIMSGAADILAARRLLVVLEPDSALSMLICDHTASTDHRMCVSQVSEIVLGSGAELSLCDMEESTDLTSRHSMTFVSQDNGSKLHTTGVTLKGGNTRNEYTVDIIGHECVTNLNGIAVGCGSQHIDNRTTVNHHTGHSRSRQLFKYVLDDRSTGAFGGTIVVADGAAFTEAYQSNRNVLASTDSRMYTRPHLEIYNDDVKCSHGATTGQLDQEALFYMRTRGIPLQQARVMLMQAFMSDVIDAVDIPGLRERLQHLVERRFHRLEAHCATCTDPTTDPYCADDNR